MTHKKPFKVYTTTAEKGKYTLWFAIDQQSFHIDFVGDWDEVNWMGRQLRAALTRLYARLVTETFATLIPKPRKSRQVRSEEAEIKLLLKRPTHSHRPVKLPTRASASERCYR